MSIPLQRPVAIFVGTSALPCPYLAGRIERKAITRISSHSANRIHTDLVRAGFRRSHGMAYRPACPSCNECRPVRIDVARFSAGRRFRRARISCAKLTWRECDPVATREQFDLFSRYQAARHFGGEMEDMGYRSYQAMIEETPVDTRVIEARDETNRLVAVSLTDRLPDGLSGIYKFWDPDQRRESLGTATILWQVERARSLELRYFYLGYWIAESPKMAYKQHFRPLEELTEAGWRPLVHTPEPQTPA